MDIKKMIKDQQELDEVMFKKGNKTLYPFKEIYIAYKVGVGKALNEWGGFKYWKTDKFIDREALLEELADCLHFALSLEGYFNEYWSKYEQYEGKEKWEYLEKEYDIEQYASCCFKDIEYLGNIIALALRMGFTREELVESYYKINNKFYKIRT